MKRILFLATFAITALTTYAQEIVYDPNAEVRPVTAFSAMEVSGTISVYLSQGNQAAIAISAGEEKYNSKIKTEVKDGVLRISVDAGLWNGFSLSNRKLKAYVSVVDLNRIEVSGASLVSISGALKTNALKLEVSGASEMKGAVDVKNLTVDASGASVFKITGKAESGNISASGAAKVNAFDLQLQHGKVDAAGASHVTIMATKELSANASGGSSVQYRGEAALRSLNASGGASIKKKSS
jgi:hypothetical protein